MRDRICIAFVLLFLSNGAAWGGDHKPSLPPADAEDDQSYVMQIGYASNAVDSRLYRVKYAHPLFSRVKMSLVADYADTGDRAELLAALQIYPVEPLVYFILGGGASKGVDNSGSFVIKSGLGFEYNVSPLWYLDVSGGRDWESGISGRWTLLLGLGKRF